jgi:hypothetical protein
MVVETEMEVYEYILSEEEACPGASCSSTELEENIRGQSSLSARNATVLHTTSATIIHTGSTTVENSASMLVPSEQVEPVDIASTGRSSSTPPTIHTTVMITSPSQSLSAEQNAAMMGTVQSGQHFSALMSTQSEIINLNLPGEGSPFRFIDQTAMSQIDSYPNQTPTLPANHEAIKP